MGDLEKLSAENRRNEEMEKIYDGCDPAVIEKLVNTFPICRADAVKINNMIEDARQQAMREHHEKLIVFSKEIIDICSKNLESNTISRGDVVATLEMTKAVFLGSPA